MPKYEFAYGDAAVSIDIEGASEVISLSEKQMEPIADVQEVLYRALETDAIGAKPIKTLIVPGDEVTIVISDITRFWMRQDRIVLPLVNYLNGLGLRDQDIKILVALGSHRKQTEVELKKLVTEEIYGRVQVLQHDSDAGDMVYVGTTSYGTPVKINPLVAKRKTILISGTVHHLLAGYGGGRKSIVPGVSSAETICSNHLLSLHPIEAHSDSRVGLGKLRSNPVHLDMMEAARLAKPLYGINIAVDAEDRVCGLFCGDVEKAWTASCEFVNDVFGVPIQGRADVVVAGCGGFPKDINLYQSVKTLINGAQAVKNGGTMVFLTECREGGGAKAFFDWIEPLKRGTIVEDLRAGFTIAGYIFFAFCELMQNFHVKMLTAIPPEVVEPMGIEAYADVEALQAAVDFTDKRVYVMQHGGSVVPCDMSENV